MNVDDVPEPLRAILELARWAPSGDNEQCWAFEVLAHDHLVVHGHDTRDWCVYDLDGTSSQIGIGALLETLAIAASAHGLAIVAQRDRTAPDDRPLIDVRLVPHAMPRDALVDAIETRSVQRRALSTRPLTADERQRLDDAVGPRFAIVWRSGPAERRRMAALLFASAKLRLVMPEAYAVHRDAIDWGESFSEDRVPERAVGADPVTAMAMRWVMRSWPRVRFVNRFLAGTWAPRVQLDVLPALRCAGHFLLVAARAPDTIDDFIDAGRAMQRFWLTATALGLQLQPEMTPLIFARYDRESVAFSTLHGAADMAHRLRIRMERNFGADDLQRAVFMGRVGAGPVARHRSLRKPLDRLLWQLPA